MVLELPESAAHVATDPKRVYQLGAGFQPLPAPGAPFFFLTRLRLRPSTGADAFPHHMLDGLRRSLVSYLQRSETPVDDAIPRAGRIGTKCGVPNGIRTRVIALKGARHAPDEWR